MKITKYPQSCFMIETMGKTILVDPGNLAYRDDFAGEWYRADYILITHKHGDHCFAGVIADFAAEIYSSAEVAAAYPELKTKIVKNGDVLHLADGLDVLVVNAVHGYLPHLKGELEIRENIGYIVHAEDKKIYFTSDTICFENDYKCDVLCAAAGDSGLCMTPFAISMFAKECGAHLVLPCHMDHPKFPVDMIKMKKLLTCRE
jgi:L-ascorbate metabolism protein UlaG (beta-lactamase superfamily)